MSATRSIVVIGMTSVRRRGPNTAIPNAWPAASRARPPSLARASAASSSMRASMTPPRKLRHWAPTNDTTPRPALAAPSRAPTTRASAPVIGAAAVGGALGRSVRSTRNRATSVDGSRPTTWAEPEAPSWAMTVSSPSSGIASSAATMRPGRQEKPVERARADRIETRLGETSRTIAASAADKPGRREEADWSDMGGSFPLKDAPWRGRRPPRQMVRRARGAGALQRASGPPI